MSNDSNPQKAYKTIIAYYVLTEVMVIIIIIIIAFVVCYITRMTHGGLSR